MIAVLGREREVALIFLCCGGITSNEYEQEI
jgi:hypothetical protein